MKERPKDFNTEMVRAILDGCKTQTRMVMKIQPPSENYKMCQLIDTTNRDLYKHRGKYHWAIVDGHTVMTEHEKYFRPPCEVGDRLWVRETFAFEPYYGRFTIEEAVEAIRTANAGAYPKVFYMADGDIPAWLRDAAKRNDWIVRKRPSGNMPRWASRISLEITDVRVERLQDISARDVEAEGIDVAGNLPLFPHAKDRDSLEKTAKFIAQFLYSQYWDSINAKRGHSWESNPRVWVRTFKMVKPCTQTA